MQPDQPPPLPTVLYRQALLASGITEDEIRWARSKGSWTKLHRGTYCASESMTSLSKEDLHRLRAIALAGRSPQLVLSHVSAAAVHRLPLFGVQLDTIHLTRLGANGGRSQPGRVVHVADLRPDELLNRNGFQITSVARTLLDHACTASFAAAVVAIDHALHHELVTPEALGAALSRTRHRRGAAAARRALLFANGRSESPGESRLRLDLHRAGLPAPVLQVRVYAPDGTFLGRVDLGYPELGLLIEFDGKIKYTKLRKPGQSIDEVVMAEKDREDLIRGLGYTVIRFDWNDLGNPAAVVARIKGNLDRSRRIVLAGGLSGSWTAKPALQIPRT
jgi:very-short-patch-repair endonuclease